MSEHETSHAKRFITIIIAVVRVVRNRAVALVISPLIFQSIKAANASGNITGTLATIVNLVPLFYYLAVAIIVVADVITFLRVWKQTVTLPSGRKIVWIVIEKMTIRVFYSGLRPLGA